MKKPSRAKGGRTEAATRDPERSSFFHERGAVDAAPGYEGGANRCETDARVLGVLLLGFLFLLPKRCTVNMAFLRQVYAGAGGVARADPAAPGLFHCGLCVGPAGGSRAAFYRGGRRRRERAARGQGRAARARRRRRRPERRTRTLLEGLNRPHGMDFHDGGSTSARPTRSAACASTPPANVGPFERVVRAAGSGNHWTRTVRFGPDAGSTSRSARAATSAWRRTDAARRCCASGPTAAKARRSRRASATPSASTGGPTAATLSATDNGRDLLGDDFPPCELNRVVQGGFYGWPYANGARPRPRSRRREQAIARRIPPAHAFRAHNAPLGMVFLAPGLAGPSARRRDRRAARLVEPDEEGRLSGGLAPLRGRRHDPRAQVRDRFRGGRGCHRPPERRGRGTGRGHLHLRRFHR